MESKLFLSSTRVAWTAAKQPLSPAAMRVPALLAMLLSMVVSAQEITPPRLDKWVDNVVKPIAPGEGEQQTPTSTR